MAEYKNPNQQGGGQDSRSLMIFSAIFLVILLGMEMFRGKKPAGQQQAQQPAATVPAAQAPASGANAPASQTTDTAQNAGSAAVTRSAAGRSAAAAKPQIAAAKQTTTVVENELYRIEFSNRGGQAVSWILKKYTDHLGKPLDLVDSKASAKFGYPLSLYTYDEGLRNELAQALYVPSATGTMVAPGKLTFDYSADGLVVHKVFTFDNSYVVHATTTVTRNGAPVEAMLAWPAGFGDQQDTRDYATNQIDRSQNGKPSTLAAKKVSGGDTLAGPWDWGGVTDLYFAAIFLPDTPDTSKLVALHHTMEILKDAANPSGGMAGVPILGAAMGSGSGDSVRIFAGPKVLSVLKGIRAMGPDGQPTGADLVPIVHYGMFSIFAKPLFYALRWLHNHGVSNWGWGILVLTLIITLAMFPTRFTMMKSSIKMQRIQPQMNAIKEKYKKYKFDDPRKKDMNSEMSALYKTEGVNMFGGCLPMLIQFPLLFAFYEMLENAIELRHAHWYWLHDLSAPDPYHILPILLVTSQFFYQLFTPSPGVDPAQQKMMAFTMPLFSGFIAWHYAAGLALYWAFSNLIGIGQQLALNQTKLGRELRAIQAKRAAKKSGRTIAAVRR